MMEDIPQACAKAVIVTAPPVPGADEAIYKNINNHYKRKGRRARRGDDPYRLQFGRQVSGRLCTGRRFVVSVLVARQGRQVADEVLLGKLGDDWFDLSLFTWRRRYCV
jgi:hypothetical protein